MRDMKPLLILCIVAAGTTGLAGCATSPSQVHQSLLTLDTHLDAPMLFGVQGWDITQRHSVQRDGSQVDLPRMIEGGLDGGFWAIYIPQGPLTPEGRAAAREAGLRRMAEIHAMVRSAPGQIAIALTADDAPRIAATGRRNVFLSMENGYPLGQDPTQLRVFYAGGVRMAGPVHFLNNDLATSATDTSPAAYPGLTPLGKQWVEECNRLGILIDASHASDAVLDELLKLSKAPIILSHSGARAVYDHPRNVDDERLRRIAAQGGVIQVSAYNDYMIAQSTQCRPASCDFESPGRQCPHAAGARGNAATDRGHRPEISVSSRHLRRLHAASAACNQDCRRGSRRASASTSTVVAACRDSRTPVTIRRSPRGCWPRAIRAKDLQQIWSGNVLRVLREAQARADPAGSLTR